MEREKQNQEMFRPAFAEAPALRKASGGGASRRQVQVFLAGPSASSRWSSGGERPVRISTTGGEMPAKPS